jgi:hypothetical protein
MSLVSNGVGLASFACFAVSKSGQYPSILKADFNTSGTESFGQQESGTGS